MKLRLFMIWMWLAVYQVNGILNTTSAREYVHHESSRGRSKIGADIRPQYCRRPTTTHCESIDSTSVSCHEGTHLGCCLGSKLPYSSVSLDLLPIVTSLTEMSEIVEKWSLLRQIPKCWAVVQPLICAFHLPRCENGSLYLPSQEMCRVALGPCKLLGLRDEGFPAFLNCNDTETFPPLCKNDVRDMKFTTNSTCPSPLVPIPRPSGITFNTDPQRHYPGLEECSLPCDTPLFSPEELGQLQRLVASGGTIALFLNFFVVATFLVDWGSAARYPALIIFYLNLCCLFSTSGWLLQFIPGVRKDILCRRDGTAREAEPSAGENLSCVMVFVVIYYFLMAALVWFVILAYSWHISFKALGRMKESIDAKSAYFHLAAWSLPLVLTITTLALREVHADSSSGVCFVGTAGGSPWGAGGSSVLARTFLLIAPIVVATLAGGFFLIRGLVTLVSVRINSQDLVSARAGERIQAMVVRIALFSIGILVLCVLTIACHLYEFKHADSWHKALHRSVICHTFKPHSPCLLSSQPSLSVVQLHLMAPFILSALVASWLINSKSRATWLRILRRRSPCCVGTPMYADPRTLALIARTPDGEVLERGATKELNIQKHKVIARAFAKRRLLHEEGRLSISFRSSHGDPVAPVSGMAFDVDSQASSRGFSSTWAAALPQLVTRRNAIANAGSASSVRRNSIDSDISYSVRRVSVESRRNSMDSQISLQYSEIIAHHQTRSSRSRHKPSSHHGSSAGGFSSSRRSGRDKRRKWGGGHVGRTRTPRVGPRSRRGSISSQDQDSQMQILQALQMAGPSGLAAAAALSSLVPNQQQLTNRRAGNAGIEGPSPSLLARLRLPGHSSASSDDDEEEVEQIEMLALPPSTKTESHSPEQVSAALTHDMEAASSGEESSSSSFSPELSLLAAHESLNSTRESKTGDLSHPNSRHDSHKSHRSPANINGIPKISSRKSREINKSVSQDDSSSSGDEEIPFLAEVFNSKEFKRKTPSQTSKTSSKGREYKETREIGIQASLDLEQGIIRKSGRKKKGLNNSYNAHRLVSELAAQNSRSKSAGNF